MDDEGVRAVQAGVPNPRTAIDERLKRYVNWALFAGAALYSAFHAGFVIWHTVRGTDQLTKVVYDHFAAIVGLPFAGFAALALVLLLESRSDQPIEFKALGFEFKGASGPIVLWVLCFLAITGCLKLMW
jgi:cation transporter-like permease